METLKFILTYFFKLALGFFLLAFVWWLVSLFFPGLSLKSVSSSFSSGSSTDWLPAPRNYSGLLRQNGEGFGYGTTYVHGDAYNGYGNSNTNYTYASYEYTTYTATGTIITRDNPRAEVISRGNATTTQPSHQMYLRNLSIYEGGNISTGISFTGEVRDGFFRDGKFPIVMLDYRGAVVGITTAYKTTQWATPGWARFEARIIHPIPKDTWCTLVFEESLLESERTRKPLRVPFGVRCN